MWGLVLHAVLLALLGLLVWSLCSLDAAHQPRAFPPIVIGQEANGEEAKLGSARGAGAPAKQAGALPGAVDASALSEPGGGARVLWTRWARDTSGMPCSEVSWSRVAGTICAGGRIVPPRCSELHAGTKVLGFRAPRLVSWRDDELVFEATTEEATGMPQRVRCRAERCSAADWQVVAQSEVASAELRAPAFAVEPAGQGYFRARTPAGRRSAEIFLGQAEASALCDTDDSFLFAVRQPTGLALLRVPADSDR
jgi:hypothetical protein